MHYVGFESQNDYIDDPTSVHGNAIQVFIHDI